MKKTGEIELILEKKSLRLYLTGKSWFLWKKPIKATSAELCFILQSDT